MSRYVTHSSDISCAFCSKKLSLQVNACSVKMQSKKTATMSNCIVPPPEGG